MLFHPLHLWHAKDSPRPCCFWGDKGYFIISASQFSLLQLRKSRVSSPVWILHGFKFKSSTAYSCGPPPSVLAFRLSVARFARLPFIRPPVALSVGRPKVLSDCKKWTAAAANTRADVAANQADKRKKAREGMSRILTSEQGLLAAACTS